MSKQYLQTFTVPDSHPTDILSVAVTSTQIITASGSPTLRIYACRTQTIHADTPEAENPYPLAQTLDNAHHLGCHHVCVSRDENMLASVGFGSCEVRLWKRGDEAKWEEAGSVTVEKQRAGEFWAPALSETGQYLACTTCDGRINVYDTHNLTTSPTVALAQYETQGSFGLSISLSPNGEMTASGHQNGTIYIFNNTSRRLAHSLPSLLKPVRAVQFSPANTLLAAAGDARIIALYDTQSGETVAQLTGHTAWVMSVDWNWSGEYLLSGSYDGKAKVWSIERRECVATQTESDQCLWAVRWLYHAPTARNEAFVMGGAERKLLFYREASGL